MCLNNGLYVLFMSVYIERYVSHVFYTFPTINMIKKNTTVLSAGAHIDWLPHRGQILTSIQGHMMSAIVSHMLYFTAPTSRRIYEYLLSKLLSLK